MLAKHTDSERVFESVARVVFALNLHCKFQNILQS